MTDKTGWKLDENKTLGTVGVAGAGEVLHTEAGVVARSKPLLCSSVSDKGGENLFYTLL